MFRSNCLRRAKGSLIYKRMFDVLHENQAFFLEHYHKRSNVESVFNMIKTKFRDNLRSKEKTAQINELLLKILCHNICVVIQEILELELKESLLLRKRLKTKIN